MTQKCLRSFRPIPNFNDFEAKKICDKLNKITEKKHAFPCEVVIKVNKYLSRRKNMFVKQWEWDRSNRHYPGLILKDIGKKILFDPKTNSYNVTYISES